MRSWRHGVVVGMLVFGSGPAGAWAVSSEVEILLNKLVERGVLTFADHTRNTLDLSVIPAVKRLSHLPILVDPSHGTGRRDKVLPLSRAAVAVGADGLLVEVHHQPEQALSDGYQSIVPAQLEQLMSEVRQIGAVVGRPLLAAEPRATAKTG